MRLPKLIFFLLLCGQIHCQITPQLGSRSIALGGTGLLHADVWSVYNNPGILGKLQKSSIGVTYQNRFSLQELSTQSIAYVQHTDNAGNFGMQFQHYGFHLYREFQAGLSYAKQLSNKFYGGFGLNWQNISLGENYGQKNFVSGSIGLAYILSQELSFGFRVQNLSRARLAEFEDERYPTRFALGVQYTFSPALLWNVELEKSILFPTNLKTGVEYLIQDVFAIRFGVNSAPFQSSFGFGLALKKMHFDMAANWHSQLGLSPAFGFLIDFGG
jgi:hypothetical protein